jgi:hypothetical protein
MDRGYLDFARLCFHEPGSLFVTRAKVPGIKRTTLLVNAESRPWLSS